MCQDWYSVIGQVLDLVGFSFIAWEWFHQLKREHDKRTTELQKAYDKADAKAKGRKYVDADADDLNWRIYQPLFLKEWKWRRGMFIFGAGCFLLGIIFQVLGSWPHAFKAC
jgi:hypothetical protein